MNKNVEFPFEGVTYTRIRLVQTPGWTLFQIALACMRQHLIIINSSHYLIVNVVCSFISNIVFARMRFPADFCEPQVVIC
jgi:uncharacterized membrane-anchored protein YitT (DUF2179 family)